MRIAFLLPSRDDAVIWRGLRKKGLIKQWLKVHLQTKVQLHGPRCMHQSPCITNTLDDMGIGLQMHIRSGSMLSHLHATPAS